MNLHYLDFGSTDPAFNLALEQYCFQSIPRGEGCFLLWQNENAIIVGRHQNTLAQINESFVREHSIQVVRRLTGGGAVYHDLGNLNFTFITDDGANAGLSFRNFCRPVIELLDRLGVHGEITGRNDMTVEGKKFSGNAQYIQKGRVLHHGTIMFDSDLTVMERALFVDPDKIRGKGTQSVRSRVTNLRPFLPSGMTISEFRGLLLEHVLHSAPGGTRQIQITPADQEAIERICDSRYRTWDWNYGQSPPCTMLKRKRFDSCGTVELYLVVEHGIIAGAAFRGDFFSTQDPQRIADLLIGCRTEPDEYRRVLENADVSACFFGLSKEELLSMLC